MANLKFDLIRLFYKVKKKDYLTMKYLGHKTYHNLNN